jgi:hypothetical protein
MPNFHISQLFRERDFMFLKSTEGFLNYIMSRTFMFSQNSLKILFNERSFRYIYSVLGKDHPLIISIG